MLGNVESKKRSGQQRMRWLDGITDSMDVEQTPGDSGGQRSLVCCGPWGRKELNMTEQLNISDPGQKLGSRILLNKSI